MNCPSLLPALAIQIGADVAERQMAAAALAAELGLPGLDDASMASGTHLLAFTATHLELRTLGADAPGPIYVDFVAGAAAHRRRFGGGRGQPLARAMGLKSGATPRVVDATAGLGQDAFVLACLGCTVELVERAPIIAALLRDGLERARQDVEIGALARERLHLYNADGREYLRALPLERRPEVVYLDPMYPHRRKSALTSKEMRLLRHLVGEDLDAPALLDAALTVAQRRVVVKRPRLAPALAGPRPSACIEAPNTRFDLYLLS